MNDQLEKWETEINDVVDELGILNASISENLNADEEDWYDPTHDIGELQSRLKAVSNEMWQKRMEK